MNKVHHKYISHQKTLPFSALRMERELKGIRGHGNLYIIFDEYIKSNEHDNFLNLENDVEGLNFVFIGTHCFRLSI